MNDFKQTTIDLCDFISRSPSCFHVIENAKQLFNDAGFCELKEDAPWELSAGKTYYVTRNDSSLIAFRIPTGEALNYQIIASHSDSPSFKIKENPEMEKAGNYVELNVEKYGGPLFTPWFDRPLGIAGRLVIEDNSSIKTVLADSGRPLAMIPSLAIHMDRSVNEGKALKVQSDLLPVFGDSSSMGSFKKVMADAASVSPEQILGADLFLYDQSAAAVWGANEEFFSSPKLDDLQNVYASVNALCSFANNDTVSGDAKDSSVSLCCIFDNEEVGSGTKQGADSTFLSDVLERIRVNLGLSEEGHQVLLARSFMLSADNGHAVHPNHIEKADPVNRPVMNGGVVIKHSANQKYTTDAVSAAIFRSICRKAGIPTQEFTNHSDNPGGSTLGNISAAHISIPSVDIGCAQLAMHGPYETGGTKDTLYMKQAMTAFYETLIRRNPDSSYSI